MSGITTQSSKRTAMAPCAHACQTSPANYHGREASHARIRRNAFTDRWHGHEDELERNAAVEGARYREAFTLGDPDNTGVWFGEAAGLIHSIEPASVILERMAAEAVLYLERHGGATIV